MERRTRTHGFCDTVRNFRIGRRIGDCGAPQIIVYIVFIMFKTYTPADLPNTLPLHPAPGMMILPRIQFPLNMEDAAAIAMVDDALQRDRLIGIIQPKKPDDRGSPLYLTGTAGRITMLDEMEEGNYI